MRVAVIGGGAAGIFGAISAATHHPGAEIVVFDATRQPLDKVRISGGGRCNVTHHCFDPAELVKNYPRGSKELRGVFSRFQPKDTIAWFEQHGVRLKVEEDGRMFPVTDSSSTIIDCLLTTAVSSGVQIRLGARVKSIAAIDQGGGSLQYEIELDDGPAGWYDRVLLATGSGSHGYRLAQRLGHDIVPCVPSLFTFKMTDRRLDGLAGISFEKARLTLTDRTHRKLEQTGPLLVTHWGLSGPAVLKLSAWGARSLHRDKYQAELTVNFAPDHHPDQLRQLLLAFKKQHGRKRVVTAPVFPIPRRYWSRIARLSGVTDEMTWTNLTRTAMNSIISELAGGRFAVIGKGMFKEEFVTCGGVNLKEVDFKTMQSRLRPGLYFAGEILDIDGITGGFNFQSAWSTGWIAGIGDRTSADPPINWGRPQ